MTEFEVKELEEMFKRRCTNWYNNLLKYRRNGHYDGFSKIVSQCFKNHKEIEDLDDLKKVVMDIDEYYWYDDNFIDCLLECCVFLNLYRKFVDKYRTLYDDDTSLHYYTKYDEEYFDI